MTKTLFKKTAALLMSLTLVVGVMTGFVFTKPVEVKADEETVHVYYDFVNLNTKAQFKLLENKTVIFVPKALGIDFETVPCLPTMPVQGSATQIVCDFDSGKTTSTDVGIGGAADTQTASIGSLPGTHIAKVVTLVKGTGFDGCPNGGYSFYDANVGGVNYAKYVLYGCCAGGVDGTECPGNVVSYSETDVSVSAVNAMIKPSKQINEGEVITIDKKDVQMSITIKGNIYMVPGSLSDTDYKVDSTDNTVYIPTSEDDPTPLDDTIHVYFGTTSIPVKVHIHGWTYEASDEGDALYATCIEDNCPITDTPSITLTLRSGNIADENPTTHEPLPVCGYEMSTSWNYVAGGKPDIRYKLMDVDGAAETTTSPKRPGNYRAFLKVTGKDGVDYEIAKEFAIDKDGNIVPSVDHVHQWKYSIGADGTLMCECISKVGTCPLKATYQITAEVAGGEHTSGQNYTGTGISQIGKGEVTDPEALAELEMPEPSKTEYIVYKTETDEQGNPKLDDDGNVIYVKDGSGNPIVKSKSETRPEGPGAYKVAQTYENPDGSTVTVETPYTIFTRFDEHGDPISGSFSIDVPYRYIYSGTGIDYNNGRVWYTNAQVTAAKAEDKALFDKKNADGTAYRYNYVGVDDAQAARTALHNVPEASDGSAVDAANFYLDIFTEHLVVPAGKTVTGYRLTKTGKWESGNLTDEIIQRAITKEETVIAVTFNPLSDDNKPTGVYYTFKKIEKRPAGDALKLNYIACADPTGNTPGQFVLTTKEGKVIYNCSDKYDVAFADSTGKKVSSLGWGVWPSTGGVWVPDMITDSKGATKPGKVVMYFRSAAKLKSSGTTYTPASKEKKLSVMTVQKAVSVKADYKKEILKLKKNQIAYFGNEIIDIRKADFYANTKDYGTYLYEVTPTDASGAAVTAESLTFKEFSSKYPDLMTAEDYEDIIVDYDVDIQNDDYLKNTGIKIEKYLTDTRNTVMVWQKASEKKPATVVAKYKLAKRGVIDSAVESLVTIDATKGKVALTKLGTAPNQISLEVETVKNGKSTWKTTLPMAAKTELQATSNSAFSYKIAQAIYPIRIKSDVKAGRETDNSNACGAIRYLLVTYKDKNNDEGRSATVVVDKLQWFDTLEAATAEKEKSFPAAGD